MKNKFNLMHLCMIVSISGSGLLSSTDMESVLEVGRDNQLLSAKSQDKIDDTERKTDKIVNEWKAVSKQVEGLKLYNEQKRIQIQAQLDLMDKLDDQLVQVVVMQRQIPPLAQRMLESLESFIALDTPFRIEERQNRIDLVRSSLAKPKVTASEQVRQVLEAYNIEAEYGRKIDTYESSLQDGTVVNILVIGRIGMFYQTKDEQSSGRWNNETDSWDELPGTYRKPIRNGIRMAKKLAPTDMLMMPVIKGEV
ncbi:DUF3450 domain-containing protein [Gammaproteobacteria bacterium]|jgi:hypothetical protein|nr:DUF3450 domain-containing protein [Gammaproteobacteria bacterium]MDA8733226.1 DUF3450 domain-containing protein [Gammaproteobacteria bacterium]MDA8815793.1 DUF3450 domain-containing protein [Gammaproteobacteria bacterium]MDA9561726.1 DUF3450 domain-containing protein [Gammaproteobacteria bacterium]MDA9804621.1 DUF3450 domain-containing protein [Gammaproteobacteria bacterium]